MSDSLRESLSRPSLASIRAEMARLTALLMKFNARYLEREEEVRKLHQAGRSGYQNLDGALRGDLQLSDASAAAKTCAALAGALAQIIQAEIAYRAAFTPPEAERQRVEDAKAGARRAAAEQLPRLEGPIATRPQDWSDPARSHIFGPDDPRVAALREAERLQMEAQARQATGRDRA